MSYSPGRALPGASCMTRLLLSFAAALCLALATASSAFAAASGPPRPPGTKGPLGDERLSDERTITRVALPSRIHKVRSGPGRRHHTIAMLRFLTEDNAPERYLVLRSRLGPRGHPWLQIRLPRRPNGSKGWVPRRALGRLRVLRTSLEIDKRRLKARLFQDGREVWTSSVGIGAPSTPTPNGRYWIRERLD